jgi:hypothetical protein
VKLGITMQEMHACILQTKNGLGDDSRKAPFGVDCGTGGHKNDDLNYKLYGCVAVRYVVGY